MLRPPWSMVEHIGFDTEATNVKAEVMDQKTRPSILLRRFRCSGPNPWSIRRADSAPESLWYAPDGPSRLYRLARHWHQESYARLPELRGVE